LFSLPLDRLMSRGRVPQYPAEAVLGSRCIQKGPETICDLGAGVPTGTFTVFPGCAGLLIGFAHTLLREGVACDPSKNLHA
jgi:hypothetical protein